MNSKPGDIQEVGPSSGGGQGEQDQGGEVLARLVGTVVGKGKPPPKGKQGPPNGARFEKEPTQPFLGLQST